MNAVGHILTTGKNEGEMAYSELIKNSGTGKPIPLSEGKDLRHIKRDIKKNNCKELLLLKLFFYCCR